MTAWPIPQGPPEAPEATNAQLVDEAASLIARAIGLMDEAIGLLDEAGCRLDIYDPLVWATTRIEQILKQLQQEVAA